MQKRTKNITIDYVPDIQLDDSTCLSYSSATHSPSDEPITNLHFHDSLEIGYCYEGSGVFIIDENIIPFSKNDASIIFKNQIHIAQSNKGNLSKWRFISLYPEKIIRDFPMNESSMLLSALIHGYKLPNIVNSATHPKITRLILSIIDEITEAKKGYKSYINLLVLQLLLEISRTNDLNNINKDINRQTLLQITPALEFISQNYMNTIKVSTLADICFTSDRNLRRFFYRSLSLSPVEYVIKFRIKMASVLLSSTTDSILEVSNKVGFSSLSSFNRHFKTIIGMSPLQWRKNNRNL